MYLCSIQLVQNIMNNEIKESIAQEMKSTNVRIDAIIERNFPQSQINELRKTLIWLQKEYSKA
jgi:hypothetical protein